MPHDPFVPREGRRFRLVTLGVIAIVMIAVVVRGRGTGSIPALTVTKAVTNGSFYHWRDYVGPALTSEGWCALRRSRTIQYFGPDQDLEERQSPSGIARRDLDGRWRFEPRTDIVGMEEGNDFVTQAVSRLAGLNTRLTPLGGNRWLGGRAVFVLEPQTLRIQKIEAPDERIEVDYPFALSSDVFERPDSSRGSE